MKRTMRKSALALIAIAVLLSFGLVATAGTINTRAVPSGTITEALALASPGDTINVAGTYTGVNETFPIQVQKNNITIKAEPGATLPGGDGAVFVVGAAWYFNQVTSLYEQVRISGVTIEGFIITGGDIGVLIKEADGVTIKNNTIGTTAGGSPYEGIRLIDASGCTIEGNTINVDANGIGIFLQNSGTNATVAGANTLTNNTVTESGLGLFIFESNGNTVTGDTYNENGNGGVVLNDSTGNVLSDLTVKTNGGWGVRFVFADANQLLKSWVEANTVGGVELLGSDNNTVEGNIVYNNGTAGDESDDAQIVITMGDKEIFTTSVFTNYNNLGSLSGFVNQKFEIYDKLDLLNWWTLDLDVELWGIRQDIAAAIGMAEEQDQTPTLTTFINGIIAEKLYINQEVQTSSSGVYGVIKREFPDPAKRPAAIDDTAHNFTLENNSGFTFNLNGDGVVLTGADLAKYGSTDSDFGLDRNGAIVNDPLDLSTYDDDEISWDKLNIMSIIVLAARREIWNDFSGGAYDSLKEKLVDLRTKGLITDLDKTALDEKLDAALGFLAQIEDVITNVQDELVSADINLDNAKTALITADYDTARTNLLAAKQDIEDAIAAKIGIYALIADIRYKLCLVDLELPPFPTVNTNVVGKKEKPFAEIDTADIDHMNGLIVDGLNADDNALDILHATGGGTNWAASDITVTDHTTKCSTGNTIASNLIMTDLSGSETQIGMLIECGPNMIVNNAFTNEKVEPVDSETGYGEFHHMDVAIVLLASNCTIAYNSIEWVDKGIIRGGSWVRDDVQTEYVFNRLAEAAYWPEPGLSRTGCPDPNLPDNPATTYTGDHFDRRVVVWVPVLSVTSEGVPGIGFGADSQRIKHTRIAINFFEYVGTSIDIVDAESNVIDENLFYNCANGILFRAPTDGVDVPGDYAGSYTAGYDIGGAGPNIVLEKNDYYSGVAIHNDSDLAVDANRDYTLPQGSQGHATVFGNVNPPAAPAPNSYDNFGTNVKYVILGIENYYPGDGAVDTMPPNLTHFYAGVVLPLEKARNPGTIFNAPQPSCMSELFPAGWNLVSVPVVPVDPTPAAVFGDDVPFLYMWEWNGTGYVIPTQILPGNAYWIYLLDATTLDACGTVLTEDYEVNLATTGWHMVSTPTICVYWHYVHFKLGAETKSLAEAVAASWVRPFFYPYDTVGATYETLGASSSDLVCAWPGYWVKTLVDGLTMVLPIEYSLNNPPVPPMSLRPMGVGATGDQPPAPPALPGPTSVDKLQIVNAPNPIRDVHTTTFKVMGGFVEAIRVQIYDLSGQLVFEDENPGNELNWHTENLDGENLANGVYLYQVSVKIAGQWNVTKVQKLAIYR